jgi:hypothetical protein
MGLHRRMAKIPLRRTPRSALIGGKSCDIGMHKIFRSALADACLLTGIVFGLLLASPAQARPRDEVMSNAFRCAPISDSRSWLDCYYGAAQPARAALGMQPAPDAQIRLVTSPASDGTAPRDVTVRDQVLTGAFRCNPVSNDRQWLDCYYAAAQPMRAILGLPAAPQTRPLPGQPVSAVAAPHPDRSFGLSAPPKFSDVGHVVSHMTDYKFDAHGIFTVTLANGQVWQQVAGDTTVARWKNAPDSYVVQISHGFLGSYNLQVKNQPGLFKVLRLS